MYTCVYSFSPRKKKKKECVENGHMKNRYRIHKVSYYSIISQKTKTKIFLFFSEKSNSELNTHSTIESRKMKIQKRTYIQTC